MSLELRTGPNGARLVYSGAEHHPRITVFEGRNLPELMTRRRAVHVGAPSAAGTGEIPLADGFQARLFRAEAGTLRQVFGRTPISGANVEMRDPEGSLIQSVLSDPDGHYRFDLPSDPPTAYRLVVTGGSHRGEAFTGRLTTDYPGDHDPTAANVTWLTALLHAAAGADTDGGERVAGRDRLVERLDRLGALRGENWFRFSGTGADQELVADTLLHADPDIVGERLFQQVASADLGPQAMTWFPGAHGGLLGNRPTLSGIQGQTLQRVLDIPNTGWMEGPTGIQLLDGPPGLRVTPFGMLAWEIPADHPPGETPFRVRAFHPPTGLGRILEGVVHVSPGEEILAGQIPGEGGTMTVPWGYVVAAAPPGAAPDGTGIRVLRRVDTDGLVRFQVDSGPRGGRLLQPVRVALDALNLVPIRSFNPLPWPSSATSWSSGIPLALFLETSPCAPAGPRLHRLPHGDTAPLVDDLLEAVYRAPYELDSPLPPPTGPETYRDRIPVLFVHGLQPGGQPGDTAEVWGRFLHLLAEEEGGDTYLPLAFNWHTNQRLQDAAGDLAAAIDRAVQITGSKIHLVAHSFGGLVCRTYLQGLATGTPFRDDVATLVTLGTPHSGLFGEAGVRHGFEFPDGTDGPAGDAPLLEASPIPAFQAGWTSVDGLRAGSCDTGLDGWIPNPGLNGIDLSSDVGIEGEEPGYWVGRLAQLDRHPLTVPTLALLGLRTVTAAPALSPWGFSTVDCDNARYLEGDGFASLAGQRFHPTFASAPMPAPQAVILDEVPVQLPVTEQFLGFSAAAWPGSRVSGADLGYSGCMDAYRDAPSVPGEVHGSIHGGFAHARRPAHGMPLAEAFVADRTHPAYTTVRSWLSRSGRIAVDRPTFRIEVMVKRSTGQPLGSGTRVVVEGGGLSVTDVVAPDVHGVATFTNVTFSPDTEYRVAAYWGLGPTERSAVFRTGPAPPTDPVNAGMVLIWQFATTPTPGSLSVQVADTASGGAVPQAQVRLSSTRNARVSVEGAADSTGAYSSPELPAGTYLASITSPGHIPVTRPIPIGPLGFTNVTILLSPTNGLPNRPDPYTVPSIDPGPGNLPLSMIGIPPSSFIMGSDRNEHWRRSNEGPQRMVTISRPYWIGKYEVTQAQWTAVMGYNHSQNKPAGPDAPAENLSWDEATDFCRRLTEIERGAGRLPEGYEYRLPTEAEWECACRAGTTTPFSNGISPARFSEVGWDLTNSKSRSQSVGQKLPNAWGLHDMHGNVDELCLDFYVDQFTDSSLIDPVGPPSSHSRTGRGGCVVIRAIDCRSASRVPYSSNFVRSYLGFRLACGPILSATAQ